MVGIFFIAGNITALAKLPAPNTPKRTEFTPAIARAVFFMDGLTDCGGSELSPAVRIGKKNPQERLL